ncbi:alpha/beta hydrolase [Sciscionella marina]|uniref:alpha/beta hydrolase n=1 Tax=Sciscionella marina TaxID=508770 RepID=UPI00037DE89F|nr:alpha/beta fold hydrolase [Sciscionella marina]
MVPVAYQGKAGSVYGRYCTPTEPTKAITVAIHGATYDHHYWSGIGSSPDIQQQLANSGQASLAIDRPGHARSTPIAPGELTSTAEADTIHQVLTAVRSGALGHQRYSDVTLLGHSLGSAISLLTQVRHPGDASRLVLTGWSDRLSPDVLVRLFLTQLHPATLDPQLRHTMHDLLALTTHPGVRYSLFGSPREAADTVSGDEKTKDWVSVSEVLDAVLGAFSTMHTHEISLPTMVINGSADQIFCTGLLQHHCTNANHLHSDLKASFAPGTPLSTWVLPGAGHSIQLDRTAPKYVDAMLEWMKQNPVH